MPNPEPETIDRMYRWFAVECNNQGCNLTTLPERGEAQEREMVRCAHAEVGLAAGVAGESDGSARHLEQAHLRGEEISNEDDRKIFHMELRRIIDHLAR